MSAPDQQRKTPRPSKKPVWARQRKTENATTSEQPTSQPRVRIALFVFIASILGSIIGVAADLTALETVFNRVRTLGYPELCIGGSGTVMESAVGLSGALAEAVAFPTNNLRVTAYTDGSGAARRRAEAGDCMHVVIMTDALTESELDGLEEAGVAVDCAAVFAYDIIALVTNLNVTAGTPNNPLQTLELQRILNGDIRSWAEVRGVDEPVTVVAHPSATMRYMMHEVAYFPSTIEQMYPPGANYLIAQGDNEVPLSELLKTPGSITWMSAAWMHLQPPNFFNVVYILDEANDEFSVNPLIEPVDIELYPRNLVRPLYVYVVLPPNTNDVVRLRARQFTTDFLRGVTGQELVVRHHFYPYFDAPRDVPLTLPPGFDEENRCVPWDHEASLTEAQGFIQFVGQ